MSAPEYNRRLYTFCRWAVWIFFKLYNRLDVRGVEHIPASGGVLLVANHASFLDPPALGCAIRHRIVRYMARDTLFSNRLFGRLLRAIAAVPISRERGDVGALKRAIAVLKSGDCLGFFPEGTRTPDGRMRPAKAGVGFLIAKAGVPVVPAFIDGTYRAFSRHHKWIRPRKVRVRIGPPIPPATFEQFPESRDRYERISAFIMEQIQKCSPESGSEVEE
jgi:1-acyl-sn-glycerol-3-phosphate acyltransferase